jgi:hypothetical protein
LTDACSALYLPAYPEELYEIARTALFALGPSAAPEGTRKGITHHGCAPARAAGMITRPSLTGVSALPGIALAHDVIEAQSNGQSRPTS